MKKIFSYFMFMLFISTFFVYKPMQAKAESVPADLRFLGYCDEEKLAVWDNDIALLEEQEAVEMKTYIEKNIIKVGMDDYEKARNIYDWIYANVKYASQAGETAYLEPYDVFVYKSAVCGGYSNLYKAMLNLVDIPSALIAGITPYGAHVWNAVYVNGRWFYSDATWGGAYFDKGADAFLQDHRSQRIEKVSVSAGGNILVGYDNGIAVVGVENGITTVNIPDTFEDFFITSISYQLFSGLYGVKVVNVGQCITEIAQNYSATLEAINVSEYNSVYASKDGVLLSKDMSRILSYPLAKKDTSFTLPKETTIIDLKETFKNEYLVNLEVEEGNNEFSSYEGALYNAKQTELLTVPLGKTEIYVPGGAVIGSVAFANADTSKMTIYAKEGTPAHQYAIANQIAFVTLGEESEERKDVTKIFSDVYEAWYTEYVQYVYDCGLMLGIKGTTQFQPNSNMTKAQVAQILYNMENQPEVSDKKVFKELNDIYDGTWYANAVAWAYNNGVVTGDIYSKQFYPNDNVTREQFAVMMFRYAQYKNLDTSVSSNLAGLENAQSVSDWAEKGVKWAVGLGLISGVEENGVKDLAPKGTTTRAQAAAILQRFCKK